MGTIDASFKMTQKLTFMMPAHAPWSMCDGPNSYVTTILTFIQTVFQHLEGRAMLGKVNTWLWETRFNTSIDQQKVAFRGHMLSSVKAKSPSKYLIATEKDISCMIHNIHDKIFVWPIEVLDQWSTAYDASSKDKLRFCSGADTVES
jgi:hypothetical protein